MRSLTIKSALAAMAIAAAALGSAATATATPTGPTGPCENVTYVGVCEPLRDQPRSPSQQGMGDVILPGVGGNAQTVG